MTNNETPETEPILHRIFKRIESTNEGVNVELFINELAKTMKELESRMRIYLFKLLGELTEEKNRVEESYMHLRDNIEKVMIS